MVLLAQPTVDPEAYEHWVEEVDYPGAREIPSIQSCRVFRVQGPCVGQPSKEFIYDYVEVVEVTDMRDYLRDLDEHPAAQAIISETGQHVESLGGAWGKTVPGWGVPRTE